MKLYTAALAAGLWLCLAATALPSDKAPPSLGPQGLPGPGQTSPPVAPSPDVVFPPPDQALSALTIVLIALGVAVALAGVVYIAKRTAHHRRAVSGLTKRSGPSTGP